MRVQALGGEDQVVYVKLCNCRFMAEAVIG